MDKYLLLLGFQLTQSLVVGATNPRLWDALGNGSWRLELADLDIEALGVLVQAALSGTGVGRVAELGSLLRELLLGANGLPVVLIALQWALVVGLLVVERRVLAHRLARLETNLDKAQVDARS